MGELSILPMKKPQMYNASTLAEIEDPSSQDLKKEIERLQEEVQSSKAASKDEHIKQMELLKTQRETIIDFENQIN